MGKKRALGCLAIDLITMMIDDLNDEMLREILCRLPCYRTASRCKAVSKRWYSIISDPLFTTQCFLMHRRIKEKEPSSVFLFMTMGSSLMWDTKFVAVMVTPPPCHQRTLCSPFLSLQFLPHQSRLVATFKDLILSYSDDPLTGLHLYYICNPLTKQWMVLPPSQVHQKLFCWAALTYLDGRRFRVVAAHSPPKASSREAPFIVINLLVYISETCEWRNIDVRIRLKRSDNHGYYYSTSFTTVVCKGMVCIHYGKYFGAFNPFDVTDTSHGTLTDIDLPSPGREVKKLLESDGKLVAFEDDHIAVRFNYERRHLTDLLFQKRIWKYDTRLNNDEQLSPWELILQLEGQVNVKGSISTRPDQISYHPYFHCSFKVVGVHPNKEHLLYLLQGRVRDTQSRLILFDTKSKTLERLPKTIPPHKFLISPSHKLDIPCWPTPIPISLKRRVDDNSEGKSIS